MFSELFLTISLGDGVLIWCRWLLVCETVDVWSAFASEEHLKNFVMVLLRTGKACELEGTKKRHDSDEEASFMGIEEYRDVDLPIVTKDILKNLDFYEIEVG